VAHALAESLNGKNPTGRLHSEALRHMLWAVPKLKMEIPDKTRISRIISQLQNDVCTRAK
jgi:hypothetical protein